MCERGEGGGGYCLNTLTGGGKEKRGGETDFKKGGKLELIYGVWVIKNSVDYCLVRRSQLKFLKDMKVLLSEECITQHKLLVCDLKVRKVKDTRRNFVPKRMIGKLYEDSIKSNFSSYTNNYR